MTTSHENATTFPRDHEHCMDRTGINYVPCTNLTHCPSICDCPVSACTAVTTADDETRDTENTDYSQPQRDCDYTLTTQEMHDGRNRTIGTCLACGSRTGWRRNAQQIEAQMIEHVQREWMSH